MLVLIKRYVLTFKIEKDDTQFHVWCPQLPGCHTHGKTPKKVMGLLKDAGFK